MAETQEKIELLKKIAHRFHAAQVEWALGASMMLYFKGLSPAFHDIDLMVSEQDAERAGAILSEMGKLCPPSREPDPRYGTKVFWSLRSTPLTWMSWRALASCGTENFMIAP